MMEKEDLRKHVNNDKRILDGKLFDDWYETTFLTYTPRIIDKDHILKKHIPKGCFNVLYVAKKAFPKFAFVFDGFDIKTIWFK